MELWIRKIEGCGEDLGLFRTSVEGMAPTWFLHGMTGLPCDEEEGDIYTACIWGEGDFTLNGEYLESGVHWSEAPITEQEREKVLKDAAYAAAKIALLVSNYKDWGEVLLNRHPECRVYENECEAIINAALAERRQNFSDEDYEEY